MLGSRIRELRKAMGLSQDALAERLGVSRQAVTKWETDAGIPDVENLMGLANLFGLSMDELLGRVMDTHPAGCIPEDSWPANRYLVERAVNCMKDFDINVGGARRVALVGSPDPVITVRLMAASLEVIDSLFEVIIDDEGRDCIDIDIRRCAGITEAQAKEELAVYLAVPAVFARHIELNAHTEDLSLAALMAENCANVEVGGKLRRIELDHVGGHVEIDSNVDLEVSCPHGLPRQLDINQIHAISRLEVPPQTRLYPRAKGLGNRIVVGSGVVEASLGEASTVAGVELNGIHSELSIVAVD